MDKGRYGSEQAFSGVLTMAYRKRQTTMDIEIGDRSSIHPSLPPFLTAMGQSWCRCWFHLRSSVSSFINPHRASALVHHKVYTPSFSLYLLLLLHHHRPLCKRSGKKEAEKKNDRVFISATAAITVASKAATIVFDNPPCLGLGFDQCCCPWRPIQSCRSNCQKRGTTATATAAAAHPKRT